MQLGAVVLDSNDSEELAGFYEKLLGWPKKIQFFEGDKWVIVKSAKGESIPLVFQQVDGYKKPKWPSVEGAQQQMMHLDFYVKAEDFSKEIEHAVSCGAIVSEIQLSESWKVMIDPAGHPFCVIPLPADD